MIYVPNHLTEKESRFLTEEAELRIGGLIFNAIPRQELSDEELSLRALADTTYSIGEWKNLLNVARLLQHNNGNVQLKEEDVKSFLTRLKAANPSPKIAFSHSIQSIQTNLPLLGTALDETIKEIVRHVKNREVDVSVSKRMISGEAKYPNSNTLHEEYISFELCCKGRPFQRGVDYMSLFEQKAPLYLIGCAAKSLEGMVGISRGQKETSLIFYHPVFGA